MKNMAKTANHSEKLWIGIGIITIICGIILAFEKPSLYHSGDYISILEFLK